jgi:hypothetical protein
MEYGRIVAESTGMAGGGGGDRDLAGQVMDAVSDVADQVATLPPEMLVGLVAVIVVGSILLRR